MSGFEKIIGNEELKEYFAHVIKTGTASHCYLLSGEEGTGKRMLAASFAAALQCSSSGERPCGVCRSCRQAESGNHPDIIYVTHEKPGTLGVDDIRKGLVDDIVIRPYAGPYKIYIVDEAEKMSVQAQNALLKTMEEPPEYGILLLLTTNSGVFLPTILSRCMELRVKPVTIQQEAAYLKEHGIEGEKAEMLMCFTRGNIGKAMRMASTDSFSSMIALIMNVLKNGSSMRVEQMLDAVSSLGTYRLDIYDCLDFMRMWYRDVLILKATADVNLLVFKNAYSDIKKTASRCGYDGIQIVLEGIEKARRRLDANVNFELTIELLLLTMKEQHA